MADKLTKELGENIAKRTRKPVILLAIIPVFVIWSDDIWIFLGYLLKSEKEEFEFWEKIIKSGISVFGFVIAVFLTLARSVDLHNLLDKILFRVRKKTNRIICDELISAVRRLDPARADIMVGKDKMITRLFYHFANKQNELRGLAFTYWENYFANILIGIIAFLSLTLCVVLWWISDASYYGLAASGIPLIIVLAIFFSTKFSLVPKIYNLPKQQISEVSASNNVELLAQVDARFIEK